MTRPAAVAQPKPRPVRRRRLPAARMPKGAERKRGWTVVSVVVHALVIGLLLNHVAEAGHEGNPTEIQQGAGGKGPSGGGGGGHGGTGGERLEFIKLAPPPPPVQTTIPQIVPPPEVKPQPVPEVQQPAMPDLSKLTPQLTSVDRKSTRLNS